MNRIFLQAKAHEDSLHAQYLLETADDRNTTATASCQWSFTKCHLKAMLRCLIRRNIYWAHIALTAVHRCHLHAYARRRDTIYIINKRLTHLLVVLVGYKSATNLSICLAWQNGLATFACIATPYTAYIKRRTARVTLQGRIAFFAKGSVHIYRLAIGLLGKWNLLNHLTLCLWDWQHIIIKSWNSDASLIIYYLRQHLCESIDGVLYRTSKVSAV